MKVFLSYPSQIKDLVRDLAIFLRQRGVDVWLDEWEILVGDAFVRKIEDGLRNCHAALICLCDHADEALWFQAEVESLIHQQITKGKRLIPVLADDRCEVPLLLARLNPVRIDDRQVILDAIGERTCKPSLGPVPAAARVRRFGLHLELASEESDCLFVSASLDGAVVAGPVETTLGAGLLLHYRELLGNELVLQRDASTYVVESQRALESLGVALGQAVFPDQVAQALDRLLRNRPIGDTIDLVFEAAHTKLLSLPFEAAQLTRGRIPVLEPGVHVFRRHTGVNEARQEPLAGPLRILVAIGAPDEPSTRNPALDYERELHILLDAVAAAERERKGQIEIKLLEVGHPDAIQRALEARTYHVLHLSGHGSQSSIELENEEGMPCHIMPSELVAAIRRSGKPLPLIFLGTRLSGVGDDGGATFAQRLLEAGVPLVVAMQASVSDAYATALAAAFYRRLGTHETPLVSRALTLARAEVEQARCRAEERGERPGPPEYATPALFCAVEERPILDRALPMEVQLPPPPPASLGELPLLQMDALVGRKPLLRSILRRLRGSSRAGVVLTGMGGSGKSALAGRVTKLLIDDGWIALALVGRVSPGELLAKVAVTLEQQLDRGLKDEASRLRNIEHSEPTRFERLQSIMRDYHVLIVLDNFEDNLTAGGLGWKDEVSWHYFEGLLRSAQRGRLLFTCRYPVPGLEPYLSQEPVGPLTGGEVRKLLLRLPTLRGCDDISMALRCIGGHPRMLEYLDALLNSGAGRLPEVTRRLEERSRQAGLDLDRLRDRLDESVAEALRIGAQEILLDELLFLAGGIEGGLELLHQTAAFARPVERRTLTFALTGAEEEPENGAETAINRGLVELARLSLVNLLPEGVFVHRWTAGALKERIAAESWREYCRRAGESWLRHIDESQPAIGERAEATRAFIEAEAWTRALKEGIDLFEYLDFHDRVLEIASVAAELARYVPSNHQQFAALLRWQARAQLRLGQPADAYLLTEQALDISCLRADRDPKNIEQQRDLADSKVLKAHTLGLRGRHFEAIRYLSDASELSCRLAKQEPGRIDLQRDSASKLEILAKASANIGFKWLASLELQESLKIREQLAERERTNLDIQRDLSSAFDNLGRKSVEEGQLEEAQEMFHRALVHRERIAEQKPEHLGIQRDLGTSYGNLCTVFLKLGNASAALDMAKKRIRLCERIAQYHTDHVGMLRDMAIAYRQSGRALRALGKLEAATDTLQRSLEAFERLVRAEPARVDLQRDLSLSCRELGDLLSELNQKDSARAMFTQELSIRKHLAQQNPERRDFRLELVYAFIRVQDYDPPNGKRAMQQALEVLNTPQAKELASWEHSRLRSYLQQQISPELRNSKLVLLGNAIRKLSRLLRSDSSNQSKK